MGNGLKRARAATRASRAAPASPRKTFGGPVPASELASISGPYRDDAALVRAALAATPDTRPGKSGPMPAVVFATDVALANPRTLRRYLAGDRQLPALLREKCRGIVENAAKRTATAEKRFRSARARK